MYNAHPDLQGQAIIMIQIDWLATMMADVGLVVLVA